MNTQTTQVAPALRPSGPKVRKTVTINEAAVLCECSRQQVEYWALLGEFDMERNRTGRYYVDYASLLKFLGETAQ